MAVLDLPVAESIISIVMPLSCARLVLNLTYSSFSSIPKPFRL
ncbi:uncharacterized protein METZ01_LOCUS327348, partial [marine metagenome]